MRPSKARASALLASVEHQLAGAMLLGAMLVRLLVVQPFTVVWRARAEILVASALLGGWALLTYGVASLLVWQVWPLSGGLLLLSLGGWKLLLTIVREGLYALTSETKPEAKRG